MQMKSRTGSNAKIMDCQGTSYITTYQPIIAKNENMIQLDNWNYRACYSHKCKNKWFKINSYVLHLTPTYTYTSQPQR